MSHFVAERISALRHAFIMEHGRSPNKLWINGKDWHELAQVCAASKHYYGFVGDQCDYYQGMSVELMAPGTALFVGLAGIGHSELMGFTQEVFTDPKKQEAVADSFIPVDYAEQQAQQAPPLEREEPPEPMKRRIVPPSQLKRKLAL